MGPTSHYQSQTRPQSIYIHRGSDIRKTRGTSLYQSKGPGNIYENTGPGKLQRDHRLFWSFSWTGPPVILRVDSTGPPLISVFDFNGVKDYFGILRYGAMDYIETLPVFLIIKIRDHDKYILRGQRLFRAEISTGPWRIFEQADTGPYTILYGKINGTTVNFTTGHRSFPSPVFP